MQISTFDGGLWLQRVYGHKIKIDFSDDTQAKKYDPMLVPLLSVGFLYELELDKRVFAWIPRGAMGAYGD